MTDRTLKTKITQYQELQEEIERLQDRADYLKEQVKEEMTRRGAEEIKVGDSVIKWKLIVSNRFDSSGFKQQHTDLYNAFLRPAEVRRFTLI